VCITEFLRLCSEDSDFAFESEEMCDFFNKRGYPASVVQAGHHRVQHHRQSALQTSQEKNSDRIPFTLTFHPDISLPQPRSKIHHSKELQTTSK